MSDHLNYLDTYWYRVNKLGATHKDRELNASILDFEKYLLEHPSSETIKVDNAEKLASIISNKQDENKLTKKVLTTLTSGVIPGVIFEWKSLKWIVYFQEKNPNEAYHSNQAVQCNNVIKWITEYGVIRELPCYVIGNMMSTIKNNFRTWNSTITPQPNQFLDILIPYDDSLKIGNKFLMSGRAWQIVDYDITSVPGIMYISLIEDKIDREDDNTALNLANYNTLNSWGIELIETTIEVVLDTDYNIYPQIIYNGEVTQNGTLTYKIVDETIAVVTNINRGVKITGITAGTTSISISLIEEPEVILQVPISVVAATTKAIEYGVSGADVLRLGLSAQYTLYKIDATETVLPITSFSLDKPTYATGTIKDGVLTLTANEDGLVGKVVATLINGESPLPVSATKTITIRSLW